jgi:hypothetical protein
MDIRCRVRDLRSWLQPLNDKPDMRILLDSTGPLGVFELHPPLLNMVQAGRVADQNQRDVFLNSKHSELSDCILDATPLVCRPLDKKAKVVDDCDLYIAPSRRIADKV